MRRLNALAVGVLVAASILVATPAHADAIRNDEYWLAKYGISAAWNVTKGAGVTIAVIDTGVDGNHPDLTGTVIGGTDFSGQGASNGQTPVGSESVHGTLVASLAAGHGHNGGGILGAAPEASVLAISVGFGDSAPNSDQQLADAVRWAADHGAKVINMSLTRNTLDWPPSWDDAFLYAMKKDVVIVAAAGNRGSGTAEVGAPASMPGVLTVGGLTKSGAASNRASAQGITIGVSAPSEQLVGGVPGGGYALWAGTSGAAPIVSGIVALVRAAHPELDATNVINRIVTTATDAGAPGVDPIYGYGRINAAAAVSNDVPTVSANPMGDLAEWIRLFRRADATATPVPETVVATPTPSPSAGPVAFITGVLPTVAQWRDVGIPLLVYAFFLSALVVVTLRARRRFGWFHRRE